MYIYNSKTHSQEGIPPAIVRGQRAIPVRIVTVRGKADALAIDRIEHSVRASVRGGRARVARGHVRVAHAVGGPRRLLLRPSSSGIPPVVVAGMMMGGRSHRSLPSWLLLRLSGMAEGGGGEDGGGEEDDGRRAARRGELHRCHSVGLWYRSVDCELRLRIASSI